jgi:hypothetical protein
MRILTDFGFALSNPVSRWADLNVGWVSVSVTHVGVGLPCGKQAMCLNLTYADIIFNCTQLLKRLFEKVVAVMLSTQRSPLAPLKKATVYTHLDSDTKTLQDPPQSPLKRGTSDPVPSFLRRVREDQAQHWLDSITCVYTVALKRGETVLKSPFFLAQRRASAGI